MASLGSLADVLHYSTSQTSQVAVDHHGVERINPFVYARSSKLGTSSQFLYRAVPLGLALPILTSECLTGLHIMSTDVPPSQRHSPDRYDITDKLHGVLTEHYVGGFDLGLRNIACADLVRKVD